MASSREVIELAGREVIITHPEKVYFPASGLTKGELVRYYMRVADGALRGVSGRPMALKRYVNGISEQAFYQKRAPANRPPWIDTVELRYPSGRSAHEIVMHDDAQLAWVVNLGCIDLHPHQVRADDLTHPDELRIDLDPIPGVGWDAVRSVAMAVREVLDDHGLVGWPKTSGSRGFHIYVRVQPRWSFADVRTAGLALARDVERRVPDLATSRWWKEERHGVFIDYNQNAKDRTTASAYSVRPTADARVSTPLRWDEVPECEPGAYTIVTVLDRWRRLGDLTEGIDEAAGDIGSLLALAREQKAAGLDEPPPDDRVHQAEDSPSDRPQGGPRARTAARPEPADVTEASGEDSAPTGRRRSTMPLIEIARAETVDEAMAGLERWKARHSDVVPHLEPSDVLVDSMRGRSSTWSRIRINLRHVPPDQRPLQEPLEVDFDPWKGLRPG